MLLTFSAYQEQSSIPIGVASIPKGPSVYALKAHVVNSSLAHRLTTPDWLTAIWKIGKFFVVYFSL